MTEIIRHLGTQLHGFLKKLENFLDMNNHIRMGPEPNLGSQWMHFNTGPND